MLHLYVHSLSLVTFFRHLKRVSWNDETAVLEHFYSLLPFYFSVKQLRVKQKFDVFMLLRLYVL